MTVLHVTPYFSPAWAFGGVPRAVTALAQAQRSAGHEVFVLTTDALARGTRLPAGEVEIDGVRVVRVRNRSVMARARFNLSTPVGLAGVARRLFQTGQIDLVHCHELRTAENLAVVGAARRGGPPCVVSPHGTLPYATGLGAAKRAWDVCFSRRMLPRFQAAVALTPREATDVRALWARFRIPLADDQVPVVPNGVETSVAAQLPSKTVARARWGLGEGPVVLFLGRLTARKGVQALVSAFASVAPALPGARLLVAGPDEGLGSTLMRDIDARGLRDAVVMTGFLDGADRLSALAAADLFALPAVGEGFSLAVLEAMAAGVPVLVSPECDVPEIVAAGAGLVIPHVEEEWAAALLRLLADDDRRREMGRCATALADEYSWSRIAAALDAVYQRALSRSRVAP